MTKEEIVSRVKSLHLPANSYVVFGGSPLAFAGIREANDIDLLVSEEVFNKLKDDGWRERFKDVNDVPLTHDVFEAHKNWDFSSYKPTLASLLATASIIEEIPVASLEEVRKWKISSGGEKHLADIELIDKYFDRNE